MTETHRERIEHEHDDMLAWLERHYQREEGSGETDRPEYIELKALLARVNA